MHKKSHNEKLRLLWLPRVEAFKASGLTQIEFCRTNDYSKTKFNYWFRKTENNKIISQSDELKWVSVKVTEQVINESLVIRIGSASIEVKPGFNKNFLVDVVETLSKIC